MVDLENKLEKLLELAVPSQSDRDAIMALHQTIVDHFVTG